MPASAKADGGPLLGFQAHPGVHRRSRSLCRRDTQRVVLIAWGDPVSNGPAFKQDASNSAADQALQWGAHNDGVVYFPINGSARGLLVQNNEYADEGLLFHRRHRQLECRKNQQIDQCPRRVDHRDHQARRQRHKKGRRVAASCGRRSTRAASPAQTPIKIGGPAAGDDRLKTSADPTGKLVLGTLNNCAMGFTPWGTYLTCEENFNGFFFRTTTAPDHSAAHLEKRYGISPFTSGFRWHTTHPRFNADVERNEPNRFGWVVEIDPFKPTSMPVKRTALGRLKHEGAWVQETKDGKIVVYMGDDERNEYIYRFVSNLRWRQARRKGINPLDDGILYVAKFNADGTGDWLPLTPADVPPTPDHPIGLDIE